MRTRVKICGFTRSEDAVIAASLGVDAIGLVFYEPSPRNVTVEQAVAITQKLPAFVNVVGLFVNAEPDFIKAVLLQAPLDCLQFHGDELPEACRLYGKPYLKAIRMKADTNLAKLSRHYADAAGLLLDAYHPGLQGGTGSGFDWELIKNQGGLPIVLAGGLTPENAALAVQQVRPYALDVSSGVESAKGIKDAAKMAEFIKKTNLATEQL